jgi:kynurenine formamidase
VQFTVKWKIDSIAQFVRAPFGFASLRADCAGFAGAGRLAASRAAVGRGAARFARAALVAFFAPARAGDLVRRFGFVVLFFAMAAPLDAAHHGSGLEGDAMAKPVSEARMREIFESVKSWGRWGKDDQAGALNLITPAKRRAAAALVRSGEVVSLARELPVQPSAENPNPALHMMVVGGDSCGPESHGVPGLETTMDFVGVAFHGMAVSHIDALCHVAVDGRMYNGFPVSDVKSIGAMRNSIHVAKDGIVSRGVLLDIPRLRGVPWLELGDTIAPEELSAAEEAQGVRVQSGDILLVATGRDARKAKHGPWSAQHDGVAGLHAECVPWLRERDIAVLGCDGISDALPGLGIPGWPIPVHQCTLVAMGVHLLDNLRLDGLMAACAREGRWEFLTTVAPLRVERGTGSPVNPVAMF